MGAGILQRSWYPGCMATNDSNVSVYAEAMRLTAERLHTKTACMVDCLRNDRVALASMLMEEIRESIDSMASDARKMSNDYLDDFGKYVDELFGNYQHKED